MNTEGDKINGMLSRRFKSMALTSAVVIFFACTLAALWISLASEARTFNAQTLRTTQQINEKVTSAIGTLYSMGAAHQASPTGFERTQFELFAANLVTNQVEITATGRYNILPNEDLELFKEELQTHGLLNFQPKAIQDDGSLSPLDIKPQYNVLIEFFPQDPLSAQFVGLDFSEIDSTRQAIAKSVERDTPVPTELPDSWFTGGQINVFASTYFGHYVPETAEDRALQTDGGYFITLDLKEIVRQSTGSDYPLSVGISMQSLSNATNLVYQHTQTEADRIATSLFASKPVRYNMTVGAERATITYLTPAGVTSSQLISALVTGFAALFMFLVAVAIVVAYKYGRAQNIASEKALAQERERALVTLNSLQDAVITTDSQDNIDYLNPAMLNVLDASRTALIGQPAQVVLNEYFSDEKGKDSGYGNNKRNSALRSTLKRLKNNDSILDESEPNGPTPAVFDCHSSAIIDASQDKIGAVFTMRDVSKEHALTTELAYQATHDALTGLPNRRKFETILRDLLASENPGISGCNVVGYIDLDQFKLVNDTVGHAAGDELLKKVAVDLAEVTPADIEIARLGGDEFGFISTNCYENGTEEVAQLFHEFFQSYSYQTEDNLFSIRASIGLTTIKPYHITNNDVLSEVDIACYTAKDAGRNGYVIFNSEDDETKKRQGEMFYLPMLQSALKDNRFVIYTQPIVSTDKKEKETHHYECLLRLINEDGSIITPYKFIVAAERYDLIRDIDRWVIENVFLQIAKFKGTYLEDITFSINLSGQSAVDPSMPEFIDTMLTDYHIKTSNICFELTETAVITNFTQAQKLIAFLRNRGCTIALDDFGAGASSFGYLKNLEVDYIKIDGQFVKEITSNKVDLEMVRSMNNVGEVLGIKTIAEFVENQDIMDALGTINVDYAQGYHIGKPLPMENLLNDDSLQAAA